MADGGKKQNSAVSEIEEEEAENEEYAAVVEEEQNGENGADDEEEEEAEEEEEEDPDKLQMRHVEKFRKRLSSGSVPVRVHDIFIKGNERTKDWVIEAELEDLRKAQTMQELMQAAARANAGLQRLGIFESSVIILKAGPNELPDTANVVVDIVETRTPVSGDVGVFTKPEARSWTVEGSLKLRNFLGHGETWDSTGAYGWDKTSEMSCGVYYPRFKCLPAALTSRIFLHTEDWVKYSSYKQNVLGFAIGLGSNERHSVNYNLKWRYTLDPSFQASGSIRSQLGHNLLSSVAYNYKIDKRDSFLRPKRGFAFASRSEIAGIGWDSRLVRFIRQELDFRFAIPLGYFNAALNFGVSAGVVLPWGKGFKNMSVPISDRFFMGGHSSLVCNLGGPTGLLGFRSRGVGPTEARRDKEFLKSLNKSTKQDVPEVPEASERDTLGGNVAVTGFADLSFDLPLKIFQNAGVHGHVFGCAGNLAALTWDQCKSFSLRDFASTFRYSAGGGIVIPTKLARIEINYCEILRQQDHDRAKRGIQFSFSA